MESSLRKTLKSFFRRGAKPTESQFAKWLDACLLQNEDGIRISEGGLEFSNDVTIKGNLKLDGTFWLSADPQIATLLDDAPRSQAIPVGAIFLWYGEVLPQGYELCDGQLGRPFLSPPNKHVNYIIKLIKDGND
ncbi:phage tail protein [Pseudoalteromonas luteoviolacea]|uniref:Uncharacterized protein n=1 Tax=Pseudoalteromonas luteoviolacea H33 TaxID=1365251 RepID=A0A167AD84_9GAMM|nr:phage tail protein [Pseudoalteromonas luteoviolacea]KZN45251.1 hypothetical protein N476_04370 [Pseudoalteromonas luteoviolacea H33]KZN70885.1 hypothetical protein N477_05670 [Pseudoalteromonas luteoviolacea H33-S]MBQ4877215.1 tail fiber protein [Pseudoalteromonas luteoviolacea]MBQ4906076.1 tail fiber protein [Pseudoalteromonas luteoviolacea]